MFSAFALMLRSVGRKAHRLEKVVTGTRLPLTVLINSVYETYPVFQIYLFPCCKEIKSLDTNYV